MSLTPRGRSLGLLLLAVLAIHGVTSHAVEETIATGALEEIIVTARKVPEPVFDIPMSVQVLSGDLLDALRRPSLYDLQFEIPGLVINNLGYNGAGFSLRGVGNQGDGRAVAVHWNGVYLSTSHLALARLFDLERVEVLKGPQGTLYGRNATGGSVNLVTRAPGAEFVAGLEAAYGSFSTFRGEGYVNLPLGNGALRLAFTASEGDGYIRNAVDERRFAENDYYGVRASLRLNPGTRWQVDLVAQRSEDDGATGELWTPQPAYLPDPGDIRLTRVTLADPYMTTEADLVSMTVRYDFGQAEFRSISGFARSKVIDRDDCAGEPRLAGCVRTADPARVEQWSQEFQLISGDGSRLDWLLGLNAFTADSFTHAYTLAPALSPVPRTDADWTADESTWAAFGQVSLPLGERWRLTGGVRYGHERHDVSSVGSGFQDPHTLVEAGNEWDGNSWRGDLQYTSANGIMLYASVATGLNSGGFSNQTIRTGMLDQYDQEELMAWEVGGKFRGEDGRLALDVAAFYYDFDNLQVNTVRIVGELIVAEVDNAARAELYGIDANLDWNLARGGALSAGVVWLPRREFVEYQSDVTGETLSGRLLVRAPEWTVAAAYSQDIPLGDHGVVTARLEYLYRSAFYFTPENDPDYAQGAFGLLNLLLRFEPTSGRWYAFASARNLTDEDYFNQVFLQSSPGYPDTYEIGLGVRF